MFAYRTDESLEQLGRDFRTMLGIEYANYPDLLTVITKIKRINPAFNYKRVPDDCMPDAEASWDSDECVLSMRESIFVGIQRGETRSRFTVAHELAHYILGHQGHRNRSTNKLHKEISAPLVKHQESEANRLASIILAPEYLIQDGATADEIQRQHGLSSTSALLRKDEVDRIRRRRRGELRPLPQSIKEFLKNAKNEGLPIRTNLDD